MAFFLKVKSVPIPSPSKTYIEICQKFHTKPINTLIQSISKTLPVFSLTIDEIYHQPYLESALKFLEQYHYFDTIQLICNDTELLKCSTLGEYRLTKHKKKTPTTKINQPSLNSILLKALVNSFSNSKKVTSIELVGLNISGDLIKSLHTCYHLVSLYFIQCRFNTTALESFSSSFPPSLQTLTLNSCNLNQISINSICSFIQKHNLNYDQNNWNNILRGQNLEQKPYDSGLFHLDISDNDLTDVILKDFWSVLSNDHHIVSLILRGNPISETTLSFIVNCLEDNTSLCRLSISLVPGDNKLLPSIERKLKQNEEKIGDLPKLYIFPPNNLIVQKCIMPEAHSDPQNIPFSQDLLSSLDEALTELTQSLQQQYQWKQKALLQIDQLTQENERLKKENLRLRTRLPKPKIPLKTPEIPKILKTKSSPSLSSSFHKNAKHIDQKALVKVSQSSSTQPISQQVHSIEPNKISVANLNQTLGEVSQTFDRIRLYLQTMPPPQSQ